MRISVKSVLDQDLGTTDTFPLDVAKDALSEVLKDFEAMSPLSADLEVMKVDNALVARSIGIEFAVKLICSNCNNSFEQHISAPATAWRDFYEKVPEEYIGEELADVFLIDRSHAAIDVAEMLRQELVLLFPIKLICEKCKVNELKRGIDKEAQTPFQNLKDLLK